MQQRTIEGLSEEVGRLQSQIARLKDELREVRSDNHRLRRRNAELEALVTKDSHNSSRRRARSDWHNLLRPYSIPPVVGVNPILLSQGAK